MPSDEVLRQGIREKFAGYLEKMRCGGDVEKQIYYKKKFIERLRRSEIAEATDKANEQHYEVPTEFFLTVSGDYVKYSTCYWPEGTETLEQAEVAALKLICERARVEDGQSILDLGSGWGSLSIFIGENYPNCRLTTVSNSRTQQAYIRQKAAERGWSDRFECITADAKTFTTDKKFDRITAIEVLEHMKNYGELLSRIASWLKPDGLMLTQIFCHREFAYAFDTREGSDTEWMARNFFTGGTMPSADLFLYFQNDLCLIDHWRLNGKHYSKTLDAWLAKMDQNKDKVSAIFEKEYGADQVKTHTFNWRLFFLVCSEAFGFADGNEWIAAYYLFRKR